MFCVCSIVFRAVLCVLSSFCNHLDGEESTSCFTFLVFLVFCECHFYVALHHCAVVGLQYVIVVFPYHTRSVGILV